MVLRSSVYQKQGATDCDMRRTLVLSHPEIKMSRDKGNLDGSDIGFST